MNKNPARTFATQLTIESKKEKQMSDVSIIGLGAMGSALAEALLKSGLSVTVWNRSPAKAEAFVTQGAVAAASVKEAVEASKLAIACLLVYDTVYEALEPAKDALAGRTLVNLTNGTPAQARARHGSGGPYLFGDYSAVEITGLYWHFVDLVWVFIFAFFYLW